MGFHEDKTRRTLFSSPWTLLRKYTLELHSTNQLIMHEGSARGGPATSTTQR
jgi:hypothetical protein